MVREHPFGWLLRLFAPVPAPPPPDPGEPCCIAMPGVGMDDLYYRRGRCPCGRPAEKEEGM